MADEKILDYIIKDFSGGQVSNVDDSERPANAFKELKNCRIDVEEGSLVKRLQATYYNETTIGALPIKSGIRYYYGTDSKELIISYDTFLKKGDDNAGTFSNIKTGLTSNKRFCFVPFKDKLYCFNGVDDNQRYDGTTIKKMGCPAPTSIPTLTDPTVFLSHFNGLDASTTIIDTKGQTVTVGGSAQLDTSYYKFGSSSLLLANSSDYLTIPAANGQFGSNDFTIDTQLRLSSLPSSGSWKVIAYQQTDSSNYQIFGIYNDSGIYKLIYRVVSSSVNIIDCSYTLEELDTETWCHVFVGRDDNTFYLGFNGVVQDFNDDSAVPSFTGALYIGNNVSGVNFNGWLDEFRITKGVCRWNDDYSAPSEAYTTGTYKYAITYLYEGYQESNPYLDSDEDVVECSIEAGDSVMLSNIPISSDTDVTKRKVYRTLKDGDVYYYVDTIDDNTTTTYSDITPEINLTIELSTYHDIPAIWKMAVLKDGRLFGLRPNSCRIDFTIIENYNAMPDIVNDFENYEMVAEDDGEDVLAIAEWSEGIVCFKRSSTYLILTSASDPLQWEINKVDYYGIVAPWSVARTDKGIVYLSIDKENQLDLRLFTGSSSTSLGWRVKDILDSINKEYYDEVVGCFYGGRYYLSFIDNYAGLSCNHRLLTLYYSTDLNKFGYTTGDLNISCFIPAFGVGDFGQMYAGTSNDGHILRLETTTEDLIHKTKSDVDSGTLTRLKESGNEEYPEYKIDEDGFTGLFSNTVIDDMGTATIDSYSTINDMIDNCGYVTSDILYIGAQELGLAMWSAVLGTTGGTALRIRTGDTVALCNTATYSEWFTTPEGSDISGVTAKKYLQYQLLISTDTLPDDVTKLYRNNFVVKISAGLGTQFETAINFLLDTGKINLRSGDTKYPDYIKRLRCVVLEYETAGTTLNVYLAKDEDEIGTVLEAIDTDDYPNIRQITLPFTYIAEMFRLQIQEESLKALKIKSIRFRFSLLPKNAMLLNRG